jgi:phospholipase/carboxylesterase
MFGPQLKTHLVLPHLTRLPLEESGDAPPLIALFHGIGSDERDLFSLADLLEPTAVIVSARAPLAYSATGYSWYDIRFSSDQVTADLDQVRASRDLVVQFVRDAVSSYSADPRRVYIGGFSQGAMMALTAGLSQPDLVAGIFSMSGPILPGMEDWYAPAEALQGMPIIVTHGTRDDVIPLELAHIGRDELSKLPVDVSYIEYDMRHEINPACLEDVIGWLNAQLDHPWRSPASA